MVVGDGLGDVLQQHGLAGARRRDDQRALALALRADQVDHPGALVLHRRIGAIECQLLIGIERRQVVKIDPVTHRLRIIEIDAGKPVDGKIALTILGSAHFAFHRIASAQAPFADLVGRDINIVRPGKIVRFRAAQEAETIGEHFDRAQPHDFLAVFGNFLEDGEHDVLPAHGRRAFDFQLFGHFDQFGSGFFLEFFEMHFGFNST